MLQCVGSVLADSCAALSHSTACISARVPGSRSLWYSFLSRIKLMTSQIPFGFPVSTHVILLSLSGGVQSEAIFW